jgi:predicted protein tyrosine phosphatase
MTAIHVCSLSRLAVTVEAVGASHVATLINAGTAVQRPSRIRPENHLFLGFNDILEPTEGLTPPAEHHVRQLIDFVVAWERAEPMVIHCWAGVSRSTAGAFIAACRLHPERDEADIAAEIRARSPSATPNLRLVSIADHLLGRDGRMIDAVRAIGRGRDAFEGDPFFLAVTV